MRNLSNLFLLFLTLNACLISQEVRYDTIPKYSFATVQEISQQINEIFEDPNFNNANWGVVIQSLNTGEYFYKKNENKLFVPASNLKLFTSSAGLLALGSDYKFKTELYYNGKLDGSILKGDLIVKGFGDPTISGRFNNDNIYQIFQDWADSLLELGIDEIRGNIIGDDNSFDDKGLGVGWSWDYESDWYAAQSSALSFNDNCVDITIAPTKKGNSAKITLNPNSKYFVIVENVVTVDKFEPERINIIRERGTSIIKITGTIRENSAPAKRYVTVNNPTQYFVVILRDVLIGSGIKVTGFSIDVDDMSDSIDYNKCFLLFTHYSVPLKEIIKVINKNSQNFYAEQLLKVMGYEKYGLGSDANGVRVGKDVFAGMGINTSALSIVDGSGLSRLNFVTPYHIVTLLGFMLKENSFQDFYNSLPIAGVDGSLSGRMKKARTQNNVRAKTGFIGSVRSLSGYVYTGDRELLAFSMIVNNFSVPTVLADAIMDLVCLRLANFKRKTN